MKKLLSFSLLAAILFITSCKKATLDYPLTGLWIGTYELVSGHEPAGPLYYSLDIQTDKTILVQGLGADGNTYYGKGTWSLSGADFTATITTLNLSQAGVVQNIKAIYSRNSRRMTGTVEHASGEQLSTFVLERTN